MTRIGRSGARWGFRVGLLLILLWLTLSLLAGCAVVPGTSPGTSPWPPPGAQYPQPETAYPEVQYLAPQTWKCFPEQLPGVSGMPERCQTCQNISPSASAQVGTPAGIILVKPGGSFTQCRSWFGPREP
jgi:hypothetical protein